MPPKTKVSPKVFVTLICWSISIFHFYISYDHQDLGNAVIHLLLIIFTGLVSIYILYSDYKTYQETKKKKSFIATAIILLSIITFSLTSHFLKKQDDTISVLYASTRSPLFDGYSIDFREDGTYKLDDSGFLSSRYKRGQYELKDSIITLTKGKAHELLGSDRLLLRTIPLSDSIILKRRKSVHAFLFGKSSIDTLPQTFLLPIDRNGEIIKMADTFLVRRSN